MFSSVENFITCGDMNRTFKTGNFGIKGQSTVKANCDSIEISSH